MVHVVAHALFKSALFMSVGLIDHSAGTRDLRRLSGLRRSMPATAVLLSVAAASMAGLPPLFGFVSVSYTHLDVYKRQALTIGIVGLPNAGKSTLFNALTRNNVLAANYPFATIEPNVGVVGVPEPRLEVLGKMYSSEKLIPATVSFVDIAGIVKGASQGEGMGNAFLANIREADAICQVTRVFVDEDVTHVDGQVNPGSDIATVTTELILADLQTLEKALPCVEKEARIKKESKPKLDAMVAASEVLNSGQTIYASGTVSYTHLDVYKRQPCVQRAVGIDTASDAPERPGL